MNQLRLADFVFLVFWGSILLLVGAVVCAVWDRWARRRRWRSLWAELEARRLHRDPQWRDHEEASDGSV